ncbi:MAG: OmpH family outer membrane protein [Rhodobacteraceae bacterium]|jgi:Skp family chaperone for outer membrane proteins|nr:OmpH family outer membrane protein [Paracoccaceae bacterium]
MRWRGPLHALALAVGLGLMAGDARAQGNTTFETFQVPSPILTIDQDRVYSGSAFGRRVARELEVRAADLAAENRRIETELEAEERALTEVRATMPLDAFRQRADAFDARVVAIRAEQDAKARALGALRDAAREVFWRDSLPALGQILGDRGAVAILDRRGVFLAANAIDITEDAVARIDAVLGEGPGLDALAPAAAAEGDTGAPTP